MQITNVEKLHAPSTSEPTSADSVAQEGWPKSWDGSIYPPNLRWLKGTGLYGVFTKAGALHAFKKQMDFNPPPIPTNVKETLPAMTSFFTTPVFFWRPVGVMETKIACPNPKCPAPPGSHLTKSGYGDVARQVCGMRVNYTLLTERLKCQHCMRLREQTDSDMQYRWHASSPSILMQLAPAIRGLFPAVICGKRAVDRTVVALLSDRLNSMSMAKVQRIVQQGHDEWYAERRDLYQTLLFEAHTSSTTHPSQRGILPFTGYKYTPPMPPSPIPSARLLRRAHLVLEMEKMPGQRSTQAGRGPFPDDFPTEYMNSR